MFDCLTNKGTKQARAGQHIIISSRRDVALRATLLITGVMGSLLIAYSIRSQKDDDT